MKTYIAKRHFDLLLILEKENEWISSNDLGSLLNLSNKTIQKEIRILNQLLPSDWKIEMTNGIGYLLKQPFSESVKLKFVAEEDLLTYNILNLIIKKEVTNLTELADKIFHSLTTMHRTIQNINSNLKNCYDVEIIDRPLRLSGSEHNMRHLIFDGKSFINCTYNDLESIILKNKELDVFLNTYIHLNISLYNKSIFYIYLDVIIQRIKEGYEIESYPEKVIHNAMKTNLYERIEPLFSYIENTYHVKLSLNERIHLYYHFIQLDVHLIESYESDFFKDENNTNRTFLNLVDYLSSQFNLNFKSSSSFLINAFNIYHLNMHFTNFLNSKKKPKKYYFEDIIKHHNLPLERFTLLCEEWGYKNNVTFTKHTLISLLLLIKEFNLIHAKANVFIVKSHSFILNNLLLTELKRELSSKVNFLQCEPSFIDDFEQVKKPIDLIISDIVLPYEFSQIPQIHISKYVTEKNLAIIRKVINDVIKEKEILTLKLPSEHKKTISN